MNHPISKSALLVCLAVFLGGCQTYSLVKAERVAIGDRFSVEPDIEWNKRSLDNSEVWTVDGEALQAVHIYKGLEDGDVLFPQFDAEKQEKMIKFSESMSLIEIREFIEASVVQSGFTNLKTQRFRPEKFAGHQGFRVEFTFSTKDGLRNNGVAAGAKVDNKLYLVIYRGAKLHYYGKYLKHVEDIIKGGQIALLMGVV